jgi:hypothetical protein
VTKITTEDTEERYPWQAELEALRKDAEEKGHYREPVRFPDGKIPLSEALAWIDEHARRPEIMAAWSSVGLREAKRLTHYLVTVRGANQVPVNTYSYHISGFAGKCFLKRTLE